MKQSKMHVEVSEYLKEIYPLIFPKTFEKLSYNHLVETFLQAHLDLPAEELPKMMLAVE